MPYVVRVERRSTASMRVASDYLVAIRWDPYQTGNPTPILTATDRSEAFEFQTLAAAEMAAVFVGGKVEESQSA